jgi:nicotinamide-nucleotide amidase
LTAEIISVGTELLLGEIVDTNAAYISQQLADIGVNVYYRHTVGDNERRLSDQIALGLGRSDIVILCGGLGPTDDDITREAIARATGRPLVVFREAEEALRAFFRERGREITPNNLRQAQGPEGAELLPNSVGTAPGILLEHDDRLIIALPGPPHELQPMWENYVRPRLQERLAKASDLGAIYTRTVRLSDIGESQAAHELRDLVAAQTDPTIAFYASPGEVRIRLATRAPSFEAAQERFRGPEEEIRRRLGAHVYGVDDETMEVVVGKLLLQRQATLAVAESCTGGLIGHRITNVSGASRYFLADFVTYSNEAKMAVLGVPAYVIEQHGAVSEECARAMAEGARKVASATYGLATTGIAGPTGGTPEKPVGTVYVAVANEAETKAAGFVWATSRVVFKERVAQIALNMLRRFIIGDL